MISDSQKEQIRSSWRLVYPPDKHDGIICPLCNSGSGKHGTGVSEVKGEPNLLHCFNCNFTGDIFQLYAAANGLNFRSDFPRIAQEIASVIGISIDDDDDFIKPLKRSARSTKKKASTKKTEPPTEPPTIEEPPVEETIRAEPITPTEPTVEPTVDEETVKLQQEVAQTVDIASVQLHKTDYLLKRGISYDTAKHFKIGFFESWRHPNSAIDSPRFPTLIIPTSDVSYIARQTVNTRNSQFSVWRNFGRAHLFNAAALDMFYNLFVVEGAIDAMSIFECGFENVIATNSTSNVKLLVDAVSKLPRGTMRFILAFDNDLPGIAATNAAIEGLAALGHVTIEANHIFDPCKDANELLMKDRDGLKARCEEMMKVALDTPLPEPPKVEPSSEEMSHRVIDLNDIDPDELEDVLEELTTPFGDPVEQKKKKIFYTTDYFSDCPYKLRMPKKWKLTKQGVVAHTGTIASFTPCFISKRLFNVFTKNTRYMLTFLDHDTWRDIPIDAGLIADAAKSLGLANFGIQVFTGISKFFVYYINKFLKDNAADIPTVTEHIQPGWTRDFDTFILPGYRDAYAPAIGDAYDVVGDAGAWIDFARSLRAECSPIMRICLAVSFAAPLMPILDIRTFTTFIWGSSLVGKTTAQRFALSVWGNPNRMKATFNATKNGIEAAAVRSNHLPMMIDERQAADARMDLGNLIYSLSNEQDRDRMDRNLNQRPHKYWRIAILASGENKLIDPSTATGAHNRVLEIPIDFTEKIFPTAARADDTYQFVDKHHGTVGRLYLDALIAMHDDGFADVRRSFNASLKALEKYKGVYSSEHVRNVALLCAADAIADRALFNSARNIEQPDMEMAEYIFAKLQNADELSDASRGWNFLGDWINANLNRFRGDHLTDSDGHEHLPGTPILGSIENVFMPTGELLTQRIIINPTYCKDAFKQAGYPAEKCIRDFKARGWFVTYDDGNLAKADDIEGAKGANGRPLRRRYIIIEGELAQELLSPAK